MLALWARESSECLTFSRPENIGQLVYSRARGDENMEGWQTGLCFTRLLYFEGGGRRLDCWISMAVLLANGLLREVQTRVRSQFECFAN